MIGNLFRLKKSYQMNFPSIGNNILLLIEIIERDTEFYPQDKIGIFLYDNKRTQFFYDTFYMLEKVL